MAKIEKPSEKEEEYFARKELERRRSQAKEAREKLASDERDRLRELHHMHCPKCGLELVEIEYKSIKIDECSACGGLWFDQGELQTVFAEEANFMHKVLTLFKK